MLVSRRMVAPLGVPHVWALLGIICEALLLRVDSSPGCCPSFVDATRFPFRRLEQPG